MPTSHLLTPLTRLGPGPLRGIIPPMITPLRGRDELDVPGLERLIEHILAGGVHGLFILGTSGEGPSLGYGLRQEVIARTCRQVRGRVPVLVGITDTAFVESVRLAQHAAAAGAQAVVAAAPYYFPTGQPELAHYLQRLVPELPLPLLLYNMPAMTKTQFDPETVKGAMQLEQVVGIKDSSGDLDYFEGLLQLARQRADWTVLVGPEELLAQTLVRGGHGGVNGGANFYPRLYVDLYDAVCRGESQRAAQLHQRVLRAAEIYHIGKHASAGIKGMKCALSLLNICDDFMAEPFSRFLEPERDRVRAVLLELGLL
jgi:dihydrodipicolinate synthase/N-acetylneuraminate lyase